LRSVFKGKIVKEIYYLGRDYTWNSSSSKEVKKYVEVIDTPTFLELDINEPALNKGNKFYNHESEKIYIIEDAMRGTEDTMVYFTDMILETIIDEKSKANAEMEYEEYIKEIEKEREKQEVLKKNKELETIPKGELYIPKKSWWRRLFD